MGKSIWLVPTFGLIPANAAALLGSRPSAGAPKPPPLKALPESRPFAAKLAIVAPPAIVQLISPLIVANVEHRLPPTPGQPTKVPPASNTAGPVLQKPGKVNCIALTAAVVFRNRASPT